MLRTIICGGPRVGKTTLATALAVDADPLHTDSLVGTCDEAEAVRRTVAWISLPGPWVVEGCTAVRALRAWLAENDGAPAERVFWSDDPKVSQTPGQARMAKGCATVWAQVENELRERGVAVQRF